MQYLTAMLTVCVYVFNILTIGLSNLNVLFESALKKLLQDLDGVVNIADDIFMLGSTQAEQDHNEISFLERCLEVDLKLNVSKVRLNCTKVPFLGQKVSAQGIKPEPGKVKASKE